MLGTGVQQLLACASRGVLGRASGVSQPCGDAPLGLLCQQLWSHAYYTPLMDSEMASTSSAFITDLHRSHTQNFRAQGASQHTQPHFQAPQRSFARSPQQAVSGPPTHTHTYSSSTCCSINHPLSSLHVSHAAMPARNIRHMSKRSRSFDKQLSLLKETVLPSLTQPTIPGLSRPSILPQTTPSLVSLPASTTSPSAEVLLHPRRGRTRSNGAASLAPSVTPMGVTHADIAYKLTLGPVGKEAIKVMEKIVGNLMAHGKKAVAQRILLDAMLIMRERLAAGEAAVASEGAASESAAGGTAAVTAAAGGARSAAAAKGKGKGK